MIESQGLRSGPADQSVAVIGTGIAGMTAARLISLRHRVTVYEAAPRLGGHTNTVDVETASGSVPIDTGFIVFNEKTYPNFCRLLEILDVASKPSDMCFSVRSDRDAMEWGSSGLRSLFSQPSNLARPGFYRMLADVVRFNRQAGEIPGSNDPRTLGEFLGQGNYGREFRDWYLLPMTAAIWSTAPDRMDEFPVEVFARFLDNHGLLSLTGAPEWRVIENGSRSYIDALVGPLADQTHLSTPVKSVRREERGVLVDLGEGEMARHDEVVFAVHSDQALRLLDDPSSAEKAILTAIEYQPNEAVLHRDASLMPRRRSAWSAWNSQVGAAQSSVALTYWMNRLQGLGIDEELFVTLNQTERIDPSRIIRVFQYEHPLFNHAAIAAQKRWHEISGQRSTHYCGAYWGYGFHEDGVVSGLKVAEHFGVGLEDLVAPGFATEAVVETVRDAA